MKHYDPPFYKVVFFSSAPIWVPFLQQLTQDKRFEVVGVVTAPDKPSGRGLEVKPNVVKEAAYEYIKQWARYFILKKSLENWWEQTLQAHNISRREHKDWWVVIYTSHELQNKTTTLLQSLLVEWPRYFEVKWSSNLIVFKDVSFDIHQWDSTLAKDYWRTKNIPEEQLDWKETLHIDDVQDYIFTPEKINPEKSDEWKAFAQQLKDLDADFFVVIAYGKIMPQSILDIPKVGPINVHGSLLPKYRGASPIQSVLLNNDKMTGITLIYMNAKMDEWDEIAKLPFSIDFSRTAKDIIEKMTQIGPEFLCNSLWDFGKEHLTRSEQDHTNATYCTKIEKEEWEVDPWSTDLATLYNKYRAYFLRPKIYFMHNGKRVIVEKLVLDKKLFKSEAKMVSENNELHSSIVECIVKPEGKKAMSWNEFVRGYIH